MKKWREREQVDFSKDYYKGIASFYFFKVLDTMIELGQLKDEKGLILDFGCGVGKLKERLKPYGVNIIGYDCIEKISDVKNYRALKPSKIVCGAVLELLSPKEIDVLLHEFKKMNPHAVLVVSYATRNTLSRICAFLKGIRAHDRNKSTYKQGEKVIKKLYQLKERKIVFSMSQVSVYEPRKI